MRMPKGINVKDIKVGTGETAEKGKYVVIHYGCYLNRGEKCDSSEEHQLPCQFQIGKRNVFIGLDKGVLGMRVGGVRTIKVSPHLAYDERHANPKIPPDAVLRYEVKLLFVNNEWKRVEWIDRGSSRPSFFSKLLRFFKKPDKKKPRRIGFWS